MPSPRDTLASAVAADAVPAVALRTKGELGVPTALILGDSATPLVRALELAGRTVTRWHRHLTPDQVHSPWPPAGPFGQVWVRLPRSGLEVKMLLAAAASRVAPHGVVLMFGAKDEGIRSQDKHVPESLAPFETHLIKRRCRVLLTRPTALRTPEEADDPLEAWRTEATLDWGQGPRRWVHYPGMFAHGRLDEGTALLIRHISALPRGARILDYGAGSGVIGAAALDLTGDAKVTLMDSDALALAAVGENVPAAHEIRSGTNLDDLSGPYDLVVSNPPFHEGKAETLKFVTELIKGSTRVLARGGRLLIVVQRRLPIESVLARSFRESRVVADEGPFRVWDASAPRSSR